MKCNICNECLNNKNANYIHGHLLKHANKLNRKYIELRVEYLLYNFPEFSTKESFEQIYNETSIPMFKKKYNIGQNDIFTLCNYYNITPRNIKEANKSGGLCQKHIIESNLKKYGTTNVLSKGTPIYEKRNKTVQEKYGVSNVFAIEEIKNKLNSDDFWIEKYGLTLSEFRSKIQKEYWNTLSDDEKTDWLEHSIHKPGIDRFETIKHNSHSTSSIEKQVKKFLIDLDYNFIQQKRLLISKRRYYYYDLCIDSLKLMIEINGSYWHANPRIYKKDDLINYPGQTITAFEKWQTDILKENFALKNGYRVIAIWDDELKNCTTAENFKDLLLQKITELEINGYTYISGRNTE